MGKWDSAAGAMGVEVGFLRLLGVAEQTRGCGGDARMPGTMGSGQGGPQAAAQAESAGVVGEETRRVGHGGGLDLGRVSMTSITPTPQDRQRVRLSAERASTVMSGASTATGA